MTVCVPNFFALMRVLATAYLIDQLLRAHDVATTR